MGESLNILAIDPGFKNTGWCVAKYDLETEGIEVQMGGTLKYSAPKHGFPYKSAENIHACESMMIALNALIEKFQIDVVIAEVPSQGGKNYDAVVAMTFATSYCAMLSGQFPLIQLTPRQVKMGTVGHDDATKYEMITWAVNSEPDVKWATSLRGSKYLPNLYTEDGLVSPSNEHMADAVATLHVGIVSDQFIHLIGAMSDSAARNSDENSDSDCDNKSTVTSD